MLKTLAPYFFLYVFFSLSGWFLEFLYRSWKARRLYNPGFLLGPYLPLYGSVAIFLALAVNNLSGASLPLKALTYVIITTGTEFLTGFVFEHYFHRRLWDYGKEPFCLMNHVCLRFSLCWLFLAFAFEYSLLPAALSLYLAIPNALTLAFGIGCLMFLDAFLQFTRLYLSRRPGRAAEGADLWQEFSRITEPLVAHPDVSSLSRYLHHRSVTRLDHCLDVAWLSYLIARHFSCDVVATVRGALLHDLFYYEWLTEGPRLHGFRHPRICLANARLITALTPCEEDIIMRHMWPLTFIPPRYMESWIVCFVDTYCTIKDYLALLRNWCSPEISVDRES